jgi:hypothetical protein
MALNLSLSNIFQVFSTFSPILLIFTIILISIFNQDIKGLIYLTGIFILSFICILAINLIRNPVNPNRSVSCELFDFPFYISAYDSPSYNSAVIAFTFMYFLLPMIYNNRVNLPLVLFLMTLFVIDAVSKITNRCTGTGGVVLGASLGLFFGLLFYNLLVVTNNKDLLFFDEFISNQVMCSKPTKQNFKCAVYKNGEIIQNL